LAYYNYWQGPDESLADYLHHFCSNVDVLEHYGGTFGNDKALLDSVKTLPDAPTTNKELLQMSCDCMLALHFLKQADQKCFSGLWIDLENKYTCNNDQYPTNLTAAYSLLVNFRIPKQPCPPFAASTTPPCWHDFCPK
jgi:hypothetical protein